MSAPPPAPVHPAKRVVVLYGCLAAAFLLLAPFCASVAGAAPAVVLLGCAAFLGYVARTTWIRMPAVQHVNLAVQQLTRGNLASVRAHLAAVGPRARRDTNIGRAVLLVEALTALHESRLEDAEAAATAAIELPAGILLREAELQQRATARATRALVRAARGDAAGAKEDADVAEQSVHASPEVVARARLVRAVLMAKLAYHEEALRTYLVENASLVLEHGMPRERLLFRALRRMSRSPARSVYREAAKVGEGDAPSKTATWIAAIAPEAAPFASGDRMLADVAEEHAASSATPADVEALARARRAAEPRRTPGGRGRLLAVWAALIVMLVAVWELLAPPTPGTRAASAANDAGGGGPLAFLTAGACLMVVVAAAAVAVAVLRARRSTRELFVARRLAALGDRARAVPLLEGLVRSSAPLTAAGAGLELARLAARAGDFPVAIAQADAAMAKINTPQLRPATSDLLLPALMAESAAAMAVRGGTEEASAELAVLERDFPTYSQLALAQLRIHLLVAIRRGERDRAHALARARTSELRLPYREELLADLVLASRGDLDDLELARVDAEVHENDALRVWIDRVAPGLREERRVVAPRPRVAARASEAEELEVAEAERVERAAAVPVRS
ncbi:MAG: putative secreted protein [Labilithrix sp.]|nr:putative secreted protein [Labilithrix sp.]